MIVPLFLLLALADCDDVTAGPSGDLFLACHSPGDRFPGPVGGHAKADDVMDGYVVRLRRGTYEVVYVTRLGGGSYDAASRVVVDGRGNAWVAGFTKSADFPVTADAWQGRYGGAGDMFVVRLSPEGRVEFSTFAGGAEMDYGNAIVLDGDVPVFGGTSGGDGFVQRGAGRRVRFGGSGEEKLTGMAFYRGKVFAVGYTQSGDWGKLRGGMDAFVVRLDARSLAVEQTRYFGGSGNDSAWGVAVDRRGRVYLAGQTDSPDLPGAGRGYQKRLRGGVDAFVARLDGPATYFGGSGKDEAGYDGQNIAIDGDGNIWVAGMTYSSDLAAEGKYGGGDGDGFVVQFGAGLDRVRFASYAGGPGRELGEGIALIPGGAVMTMVRFQGREGIAVGVDLFAQSVVTVWPVGK